MKLNKNTIAILAAAGTLSSVAHAGSEQLSAELGLLDQKAASSIQSILDDSRSNESEKVSRIEAVMKKVNFAKEVQRMRLKSNDESTQRIGQGMTCGDYNL